MKLPALPLRVRRVAMLVAEPAIAAAARDSAKHPAADAKTQVAP